MIFLSLNGRFELSPDFVRLLCVLERRGGDVCLEAFRPLGRQTLSTDDRFCLRKLSQEEYERQDREQRLSAADEKALLAAEEVKTYK